MPFDSGASAIEDRIEQELPLILAGPILRKTTTRSITVWIALKKTETVILKIFDGVNEVVRGSANTVALGKHFHAVAVTAKIPPTETELQGNKVYQYDLEFSGKKLGDEGILNPPRSGNNDLSIITVGNLDLPSFVLPPDDIRDIRLLHGSCRQPHADGYDGFPGILKMIEDNVEDPKNRPQQLFLHGDQIYADDVADPLLFMLTHTGNSLLGWDVDEKLPVVNEPSSKFPPGTRGKIMIEKCKFSVAEGSHCLSLAEYYSMYFFCWSNVLWPVDDDHFPSFEQIFPGEKKEKIISTGRIIVKTEKYKRFSRDIEQLKKFKLSLPESRKALANIPTYMIFDDHEVTDDWFLNHKWVKNVFTSDLGVRVIQNALSAYTIFQAWGNTPEQFEQDNDPGKQFLESIKQWRGETIGPHIEKIKENLSLDPPPLKFQSNYLNDNWQLTHDESRNYIKWHFLIPTSSYLVLVLDTRTWRSFPKSNDAGTKNIDEPPGTISETGLIKQVPEDPPSSNPFNITFVISADPFVGHPIHDQLREIGAKFVESSSVDLEAWSHLRPPIAYQSLISKLARRKTNDLTKNHKIIFLSGDVHYSFAARLQYWAEKAFNTDPPLKVDEFIVAQLTSSGFRKEDRKTRLIHRLGFDGRLTDFRFISFKEVGLWLASLLARWILDLGDVTWFGWNNPITPGEIVNSPIDKEKNYFWFQNQKPWYRKETPAVVSGNDIPESINFPRHPDWRFRVDYVKDVNHTRKGVPTPDFIEECVEPNLGCYSKTANLKKESAEKWEDGKHAIGYNNVGEVRIKEKEDEDGTKKLFAIQEVWWYLEWRTGSEIKPQSNYTKCEVLLDSDEKFPKPLLRSEGGG